MALRLVKVSVFCFINSYATPVTNDLSRSYVSDLTASVRWVRF
jgi:hypothetical protein